MSRTIGYYKHGDLYETFVFKFGNVRKILVKKNGKPDSLIRFTNPGGEKWPPFQVN